MGSKAYTRFAIVVPDSGEHEICDPETGGPLFEVIPEDPEFYYQADIDASDVSHYRGYWRFAGTVLNDAGDQKPRHHPGTPWKAMITPWDWHVEFRFDVGAVRCYVQAHAGVTFEVVCLRAAP